MEGPLTDPLTWPTRTLVVVLVGAATVFLALAALVHVTGDDVPAFDEAIFRFNERNQHEQVNATLRTVGRVGSTEIVVPIGVVVAALVSWKRRSLSPLGIVLASYAIAAWFTLRFKHLLLRHEPFDTPTDLALSYPSGHLSQSVSVYVVLLALVAAFRWRTALRVVLVALLAIVFVAIVYRAAHWTTDAIGGAALGVAAASAAVLCARTAERWRWTRAALRSTPVSQPHTEIGAPRSAMRSPARQFRSWGRGGDVSATAAPHRPPGGWSAERSP